MLLICLLCPMLANGIHFQKYHIWNETTRSSNSKFLSSRILKNCTEVQERKKKVVVLCFRLPQKGKLGSFTSKSYSDGKEMFKKGLCKCKVDVKPIALLRPQQGSPNMILTEE